jgi:hypothetical protein
MDKSISMTEAIPRWIETAMFNRGVGGTALHVDGGQQLV